VDASGGVFFAGYNENGALIGRLDTTGSTVTMWAVPAAIGDVTRLAIAPDGTVFFNENSEPFGLGSLNVDSGNFVGWELAGQPAFAIVADSAGDIFFQYGGISRFSSASGRLTQWSVPGQYNEDIALAAGRVFMGGMSTDGMALGMEAVDPSRPGVESVLTASVVESVVPTTLAIASTTMVLTGQRARGQVSSRLVRRRHVGSVLAWVIPERPRMLAAGTNCVFFGSTGQTEPVIGRLTR
jgi:hypothetical protein